MANPTSPLPRALRGSLFVVLSSTFSLFAAELAAPRATGSIEGRASNAATENYLEGARITIENTSVEVFSDADGYYRLADVPAGAVRLRAFYTGMVPIVIAVTVTAGQTARQDLQLVAAGLKASAGEVVKLDRFTVSTSKEMEGSAIAINEQRFAPGMKTVVATDELGFVPEGNVAEFMKFLPGVTIDSQGGFAREVSINGVPSTYVPITVDGFSLASAQPGGGTGRNVALDMISINNLSRVEVLFSPTPESQGGALAGSVNMVPRSSFERSHPLFTWSAYLLMRDNARSFNKTAGPQREPTRKVHPGFDFTYLRPVNERFGFTLSGGTSKNYLNQDFTQNTWRGTSAATNGVAFPNTPFDKPYLSSYAVRDNQKDSQRNSFSATVDYKLTRADRLSFSFQYATTNFANTSRTLTFNVNRVLPGAFTTTSTHGAVGAGTLVLANVAQTRDNRTYMPSLVWRHNGPVWQAEAGAAHSHARNVLRSTDRGLFNTVNAQRSDVTVSFDDIFYLRPRVITVTDGTTGAPLDPYSLSNYVLTSAGGNTMKNADLQRNGYASLRREFHTEMPLSLKVGLNIRQSARDLKAYGPAYTFVGRDGRTSVVPAGSDDLAAPFLDVGASQRVAPFGFPKIQWVSNEMLWEHFQGNPAQYVPNANNEYRTAVSGSKYAEEIISAGFFRGDVQFLQRRLKLIGGVRVEQTNAEGQGPLTDLTRNYQRDARGAVILGANGRPLPITTDALATSRLTFLERGTNVEKEYLRFFPSLNASFNVRENLILRAARYYSIGRPDFNQYAGGVTLPDTESPPSASNRIGLSNAAIKPWTAWTTNVRLEYYFEGVGQISVGAFQRDFKNFFTSTVFNATPEFLTLYGLDPALYDAYDVNTQRNSAETVRMTGVDFSYKQGLTFLPRWARGVQVFANASVQRATGEAADNFSGYIPRNASWGVSLTRERYNLRLNWNYRGRQRQGEVAAGPSIEPGTFTWNQKKMILDVQGEIYVHKQIAIFFSMRNGLDATEDMEVSGPSTPPHAQFRSRQDFGSLWTIGLKGSF